MLQRESVPTHTLELLVKLASPAHELGFYLAGGTALALRFGHRISVDLDFFKAGEFEVEAVIQTVEKFSKDFKVVNRSAYSVAMIADGTKVEFLRYDYENLQIIDNVEGFHLSSSLDNALMKLSALVGRGTKKDFFDIAEIFNHFPLPVLIEKYVEKYPNSDPFMILKSLTWFEDATDDPDPIIMSQTSWDEVKLKICKVVNSL